MIIIKFISLLAIVVLSSYVGVIISNKYKNRVTELKELKKALNIFETKIKYTYEPIPDIFSQMSKSLKMNIGEIFENASNKMQENNASYAFETAVDEAKTSLNKEDLDVLKGLSKLLGKTDVEGQISQIELTDNFIDSQIEKAKSEYEKNAKLYKTLGIVSGLAIVIILV